MIRIFIADDHAVVRRGLIQMLNEQPDMRVMGEATTGQELLTLVRTRPCDVVVLDIIMPGRNGLDVLQELKQSFPNLPVLILSVHIEGPYVERALKLGAMGYVTKDSAVEELVRAVRQVFFGGKYISPAIADRMAVGKSMDDEHRSRDTLSKREEQVLLLLSSGKSVKEIAADLTLGVTTINTYRTRILKKTQMRSTASLIHRAVCDQLDGTYTQ